MPDLVKFLSAVIEALDHFFHHGSLTVVKCVIAVALVQSVAHVELPWMFPPGPTAERQVYVSVEDRRNRPVVGAEVVLVDRTHEVERKLKTDLTGEIYARLEPDIAYEVRLVGSDGSVVRLSVPKDRSLTMKLTVDGRRPRRSR